MFEIRYAIYIGSSILTKVVVRKTIPQLKSYVFFESATSGGSFRVEGIHHHDVMESTVFITLLAPMDTKMAYKVGFLDDVDAFNDWKARKEAKHYHAEHCPNV